MRENKRSEKFAQLIYKKPFVWGIALSLILVLAIGGGLILIPKMKNKDVPPIATKVSEKAISIPIENQESYQEEKAQPDLSKEITDLSVGEDSSCLKALEKLYGQSDVAIAIYEQVPFEDDSILVLADRIGDGEHYPNLYLMNSNKEILALTRNSNCWTLNYTELKDYKIFFGLAKKEANQSSKQVDSVNQVQAIFGNRVVQVETQKKIIDYVNLDEKGISTVSNSNGYILISKSQDMPEDMLGILEDEQMVLLSQGLIDRNLTYMPMYLNSSDKHIYNSFAFTYSPMISPEYWKQIDEVGDIVVEGRTDENGNTNALVLRPSCAVQKEVHSSEFPSDIPAFYLSNSSPWNTTFMPGETVRIVYPGEIELYDCHLFQLTVKSVEEKEVVHEAKKLSVISGNQIMLPKESGDYLLIIRTEKNFELFSYVGVMGIR